MTDKPANLQPLTPELAKLVLSGKAKAYTRDGREIENFRAAKGDTLWKYLGCPAGSMTSVCYRANGSSAHDGLPGGGDLFVALPEEAAQPDMDRCGCPKCVASYGEAEPTGPAPKCGAVNPEHPYARCRLKGGHSNPHYWENENGTEGYQWVDSSFMMPPVGPAPEVKPEEKPDPYRYCEHHKPEHDADEHKHGALPWKIATREIKGREDEIVWDIWDADGEAVGSLEDSFAAPANASLIERLTRAPSSLDRLEEAVKLKAFYGMGEFGDYLMAVGLQDVLDLITKERKAGE